MQSLPAEVASSLTPIPLSPASIPSPAEPEKAQVPGPRCNRPSTRLVLSAEGALLWQDGCFQYPGFSGKIDIAVPH